MEILGYTEKGAMTWPLLRSLSHGSFVYDYSVLGGDKSIPEGRKPGHSTEYAKEL